MNSPDLRRLALADVARGCREAAARYERGHPTQGDEYCHELFRRAICDCDDGAWQAVLAQYTGLVLAYVRRHPWAAKRTEDDDYWVNRTFERLWKAVGPDRFDSFPDLPALLGYLKMCVHSVIVNDIRSQHGIVPISISETPEETTASKDAAGEVLDAVALRELWQLIEAELHDEEERIVARLSWMLDLKPSDILTEHPSLFPTIKDVYRVKHNIVERLKRSAQLKTFLE